MVEFINVVELVSGGTGAATGAFCGFPLDTVKVNPYIPVTAKNLRFDFNVKVRVIKRERFACSRISSQKKARKDFSKDGSLPFSASFSSTRLSFLSRVRLTVS